ncbi:MAG: hypothetical protein AAF560_19950 [Acidobacteriota bacterium]
MADPRTIRRLILVYNADRGKLAAMLESARKLLGAAGCSLCQITHGLAGEKDAWQDCRTELGVAIDHLHRDELSGPIRGVVGDRLPCVVAETDDELHLLLDPDALASCRGRVDDFRDRLVEAVTGRGLEIPDR